MAQEDTIKAGLKAIGEDDLVGDAPQKHVPVYKMMSDNRIPVSSAHGKLWSARRDQAVQARRMSGEEHRWDDALRYYDNDQSSKRGEEFDELHREGRTDKQETENVVFSHTSALVPAVYARNPAAAITPVDDEDEPFARTSEKLITRLMDLRDAPGIGLKPKARRCITMATLTNISYLQLGWTDRDNSAESVVGEIERIGKQLSKAKSQEEVQDLEGQLMALEERTDILRPSGLWAKVIRPHHVLVDPDAEEEDLSDARWVMIRDLMPTAYLNAVYTEKDSKGQRKSLYKPSHVIKLAAGKKGGRNEAEEEIDAATLLDEDVEDYKKAGYADSRTYDRAKRTAVWWVWDKVTRRVFLYADNDWEWPVWVWNDPLQLSGFYPIVPLSFYTHPVRREGKSETVYYLDQQDAINQINAEWKRVRKAFSERVFYDSNHIKPEEFDAYLSGKPQGIRLPEDKKLDDVIWSPAPPSAAVMQLFDKGPIYAAIDRISSVNAVMQGQEFKTNTTNKAIGEYNAHQQTRLDDKVDTIEDFIGRISSIMLEIVVAKYTPEQVAEIIGQSNVLVWKQMTPAELRTTMQLNIIGGSSVKPTSEAKKKQALELGQVLGQFVQANPPMVLTILTRMFRRAFDELAIRDEEWTAIEQSFGQPPAGAGAGPEGAPPPEAEMPPEAQTAMEQAIARGVPPEQARATVLKLMNGDASARPPQ